MNIGIVSRPRVYLVGKQQINTAELNNFLADHEADSWTTDTDHDGQKLVEVAGRLCYMSFANPRPGGHKAYIDHIIDVGHGSVLEHAVFNFIITGVSRSFTHELVRHRVGTGFSQLSQRFVDESDCEFVVPPALLPHYEEWLQHVDKRAWCFSSTGDLVGGPVMSPRAAIFEDWRRQMKETQCLYGKLADDLQQEFAGVADKTLRRKMAREAARSVLPNATETKIFLTANVRALRHIFELRGDQAADAEIRRVAVAMLRAVQPEAPELFGDFQIDPSGLICRDGRDNPIGSVAS